MVEMTLREVCQAIGVTRRAVQGYEKAKLVTASNKTESGYLLYNDLAIERIRHIKLFQDMGFSIKEIHDIIDAPTENKKIALIHQKEKLNEKVAHSTAMIEIIQKMINEL